MSFSEDVLALHEGIMEVVILEERTGRFVVTERAARAISLLSDRLGEPMEDSPIGLAVILGAATKLGKESEPPKLVGLLYREGSIMFTYLDEQRILALSSSPTDAYSVMPAVNEGLPEIKRQYGQRTKTDSAVMSAADAQRITQTFLARSLGGPTRVRVEGISFEGSRWMVSGSHRATIFSKRFRVEVDDRDGAVMKYVSRGHVFSFLDALELATLIAALGMLAWLIGYVLFR